MASEAASAARSERKVWNYHPPLPIRSSPVFKWPPSIDGLKWLVSRWVTPTAASLFAVVAIVYFLFFMPEPETAMSPAVGWVAELYIFNLVFLVLVTGGLHVWLKSPKHQGGSYRFDSTPMKVNNRTFTFDNQVRDNVFWTLVSGLTAWTVWQALILWGAANGFVRFLSFSEAPIWFFVSLLLLPIYGSTHFYWIHRLLHWPPLYRRVHSLHHRNVNVGPWSGMSMHPVESVLYLSSALIFFIVPVHPVIVFIHFYSKAVGPSFSHAGFERVQWNGVPVFTAGDFHHQLHHKYFECNYGTADSPWDEWLGTFHDGTEAGTRATRERTRERIGKRRK